MKIKTYPIVERAVEEGILYGVNRLFKYRDSDVISSTDLRREFSLLTEAVMSEIASVVDFEDYKEPDKGCDCWCKRENPTQLDEV